MRWTESLEQCVVAAFLRFCPWSEASGTMRGVREDDAILSVTVCCQPDQSSHIHDEDNDRALQKSSRVAGLDASWSESGREWMYLVDVWASPELDRVLRQLAQAVFRLQRTESAEVWCRNGLGSSCGWKGRSRRVFGERGRFGE